MADNAENLTDRPGALGISHFIFISREWEIPREFLALLYSLLICTSIISSLIHFEIEKCSFVLIFSKAFLPDRKREFLRFYDRSC